MSEQDRSEPLLPPAGAADGSSHWLSDLAGRFLYPATWEARYMQWWLIGRRIRVAPVKGFYPFNDSKYHSACQPPAAPVSMEPLVPPPGSEDAPYHYLAFSNGRVVPACFDARIGVWEILGTRDAEDLRFFGERKYAGPIYFPKP